LWIGLGVAAVALIVLVVVLAGGSNEAAAPQSDAAGVVVAPTVTADAAMVAIATTDAGDAGGGSATSPPPAIDAAGPTVDARPASIGVPPPVEKMVSLTVQSEPPGAEITLNGKRLGVTPWVGTVEARATGRLVLRRDNFQSINVTIPLDEPLSKAFSLRKTERPINVTPLPCIPANKVNIYDPAQVKRKCK
jgi:hypothetical protein